jgi:Chaperone of endosialidase
MDSRAPIVSNLNWSRENPAAAPSPTTNCHPKMNILRPALVLAAFTLTSPAQVPLLLNYQGRVVVGTTNFNGTGQFKFALVNTNGTTTFWSNDGTSTAGSQPTSAVSLAVSNGLYSVLLGDTTLANMTATIPGNLFNNLDVRLRVWFNDGTNGSQLLSPDQRIGSVGYAGVAGTVPDNAITTSKISTGAVQANNIGTGAVTSAKLASGLTLAGTTTGTFSGSLTGSATNFTGTLAGDVTGTQGATQIAAGAVTGAEIDPATVQRRVTGTAPPGSFLTGINQDGTVTSAAAGGGGGPWSLNGTTAYYNGGMVGIGTITPPATFPGKLTIQTATANYGLEHTDGSVRLATFVGGVSSTGGWLGTVSPHKLNFFTNNSGAAMTIDTDGNIGIGMQPQPVASMVVKSDAGDAYSLFVESKSSSAPIFTMDATTGRTGIGRQANTHQLEVEGNASKTTAGDWVANSDARIKRDVLTVTGALDKLAQVRLVSFHYTAEFRAAHPGIEDREYLNVIAQEFQRVFPEWVSAGPDRLADGQAILQVDTYPLTIYSAASIQELNARLEEQRAENAMLKKRFAELEARLAKLEQLDPPKSPDVRATATTHLITP